MRYTSAAVATLLVACCLALTLHPSFLHLHTPMTTATYPALFICHGGGPMPLLGEPGHLPMVQMWEAHTSDVLQRFGPPKAIAVVSAHYNTAQPEVGGNVQPPMLYDYGGFPKEAYSLVYPAKGEPTLAAEMVEALRGLGDFDLAKLSPTRKLDHGVFVPLMKMFPQANIPVIPVSVLTSDDPAEHIRMGKALRAFRQRGVFFVGSGSSMHHFGNLETPGAGTTFGDALTEVLCGSGTTEERLARMEHVEKLKGFDEAQPPRAHEHLMPLLTLLGTANGTAAKEVASIPFVQANARHYLFEH